MDTLTRALRDAADQAPDALAVSSDEWVGQAWRSGRRRRMVRGLAGGAGLAAAAAVIVSLVLSGLGGMPSATVPADGTSRSDRVGVSSYPQRIGHQWWVRDLPQRPGPIAALLQVRRTNDGIDSMRWEALMPSGTRYVVDQWPATMDAYPVLSADGTRLAVLSPTSGRLVVHDLVNGTSITAPDVGGQGEDGPRYQLAGQSPGYFSGRGDLALLSSSVVPGPRVVVVDPLTGQATAVPGMDQPGGWLDNDRLLGRLVPEYADGAAARDTGVDLVVWDRRTGTTRAFGRVELPRTPQSGGVNSLNGQHWGALRRDGTLWVSYTVDLPSGSLSSRLLGFDPTSGVKVRLDGLHDPAAQPMVIDDVTYTPRSWRGTSPLSHDRAGSGGQISLLGSPQTPLTVIDDRVWLDKVLWAQDAIDGSPSWTPFGTSTFLAWWWWKEIVLVVVLGATGWWVVRRRRSHEELE